MVIIPNVKQVSPSQPRLGDGVLARAQSAAEAEDWSAAADLYQALARLRPKTPDIHATVAECRFRARDFRGAAMAYEAAIDREPDRLDLHEAAGLLLGRLRRVKRAAPHLDHVWQAGPRGDFVLRLGRLAWWPSAGEAESAPQMRAIQAHLAAPASAAGQAECLTLVCELDRAACNAEAPVWLLLFARLMAKGYAVAALEAKRIAASRILARHLVDRDDRFGLRTVMAACRFCGEADLATFLLRKAANEADPDELQRLQLAFLLFRGRTSEVRQLLLTQPTVADQLSSLCEDEDFTGRADTLARVLADRRLLIGAPVSVAMADFRFHDRGVFDAFIFLKALAAAGIVRCDKDMAVMLADDLDAFAERLSHRAGVN